MQQTPRFFILFIKYKVDEISVYNSVASAFDKFPGYRSIYEFVSEVTGDLLPWKQRYEVELKLLNILELKSQQDFMDYIDDNATAINTDPYWGIGTG